MPVGIAAGHTQTLGGPSGDGDGTYCACLQMTELDHGEHITGWQKLAGWKAAPLTGLS